MRRACKTIRPRPGTHVAVTEVRSWTSIGAPCSAEPCLASGAEWRAWLSSVAQSSRKTRITMMMITMSPMIPTPVPSARVGIEAPSGILPFIPRRAGCRNGHRRTSRKFEESRGAWTRLERVEQKDETHLHRTANIGGRTEEWDAEVVEASSSSTRRSRGNPQAGRPTAAVSTGCSPTVWPVSSGFRLETTGSVYAAWT
jgi:hypothetical protein